jgi:hypothetical protein
MTTQSTDTKLAVLINEVGNLKDDVKHIDEKLDKAYVTKPELARIKDQVVRLNWFMYGILTVVGLAVLYAVLNMIGLSR